eukprot:scaffold181002_cov18-Prasinocladus_malaysianus.AAC.1
MSESPLMFSALAVVPLQTALWIHSQPYLYCFIISEKEIDEERRLFYVAMTRAERHLCLTRSKQRNYFGIFDPFVR